MKTKPAGIKFFVLIVLLLLCCCCVSLTALGVFTYTSNQNIPIASDLIEKVENIIVSEDVFDQKVVSNLEELVNNPQINQEAKFKYLKFDFGFDVSGTVNGQQGSISGKGLSEFNLESKEQASFLMESDFDFEISDLNFKAGLDFRFFNGSKQGFVRFRDIPEFITTMIPNAKGISDQWISFEDQLKESESTVNVQLEKIDEKTKSDFIEFIKTREFLDLVNKSPDRVVGNVRTNCISIRFNKQEWISAAKKYSEISGAELPTELSQTPDFDFAAEVCTGRRDQQLYYFDINLENKDINIQMNLNNFEYSEQSESIEKPQSSVKLQDLLFSGQVSP